ncbi:MAG: UvrD-helicase domain-containing protein [Bacteroidales bacterium]|nr:UvrD-helicase domain-containing protein [Bacteroidales bacterium]
MENKGNAVFEGLNAEQKQAVNCVDGPVLIVAGAGSGKTRVLTSRIAYILSRGGDPSRILALTFTKKAAGEMKERIAAMVGGRTAWKLQMGTFHSIFIRFLREYASFLGYPPTFTIYDQSDSTSAIKACIKELQLDDKVYKPKDVLSRISLAKNNLVSASGYRMNQQVLEKDRAARKPRICDIYSLYTAKCKQSGVMDFDDILLNMNILLRDSQEALESISSRFDYILVDEYQDTNYAQYLILRKLAEPRRNICVVGDDSQSIYAFRGARVENILSFRKDYPECKIFRLEKNYRSTSNIVDAANSLIAKNENRIPKTCVSVAGPGEKIRILKSFTEQEEALRIASEIISRMQTDHARYQDFAILYRTNSQSRALEEALRKRNLPYAIYSGHSFFERSEVKDMMAYLKLAVNVNDDESFKRAVNMPARGIGETSLNALAAMGKANGLSMFKAAYSEDFAEYGLKPAAMTRIRSFCDMIGSFAARSLTTDAHELAEGLSSASGLYAHFKSDPSIESQSRASNIEELINSVAQFVEDRQEEYVEELHADMQEDFDPEAVTFPIVTLGEFLENISLLTSIDIDNAEDSANKIALMTVHSAKGLEFPYIIVSGLEENLFPSGGMLASEADIEEERRLFYVAVTRAKKAVLLSFATTRMRNGKHESNSPSRFIREIGPQYIANPLRNSDLDDDDDDGGGFGFGRSFSGFGSRGRYGMSSGGVKYFPSRPKPVQPAPAPNPREVLRNRPLPPKIPDSEFIPVPMTELKAGQRIEHNRFGFGKILEITGNVPDLKAKIVFDEYGEKILLLKYAKIRME